MARNPFQQLYVGEKVPANEFVRIFSPVLVAHAMPLFQPGNVVLSGIQGSGKSMLFKLLQPEVRAAYDDAGVDFPVPDDARRFVACGINVNTARCNEFGNRKIDPDGSTPESMFGDFFSCIVAADLLKSIEFISSHPPISKALRLRFDDACQADFVKNLSGDDVWNGYLDGVTTWEGLKQKLKSRVSAYRRYLNFNDRQLSDEVDRTKTAPGEPVKAVAQHLWSSGLLPGQVEFFVHVDQYEELATIKSGGSADADYRAVVNRMLNSRASNVSYRVGTRGYAWRNHLGVAGTEARLEEDRDFKLVDLDARLRRQENVSTSLFPKFANDVFKRRVLESTELASRGKPIDRVSDVLGKSLLPREEAAILAGKGPETIIRSDPDWPPRVLSHLQTIAKTDPLTAKLGEVWVRQKGIDQLGDINHPPWRANSKQSWVKERTEMALLRIGSIRKQRAIFCGEEDVLGLSAGNILVFLSMCQLIWDYASQESEVSSRIPQLPINMTIQSIAIIQAAREWLDRIPSDYGRSADRYKLIQLLGERLSTALHSDLKLSNPGQNGISFTIDDFRSRPDIATFLIEAVDYGNLLYSEHATRNADRRRRVKFYLNPLYCPVFRMPFQRSKEPLYLTMAEFEGWLAAADIIEEQSSRPPRRATAVIADAPLLDFLSRMDD